MQLLLGIVNGSLTPEQWTWIIILVAYIFIIAALWWAPFILFPWKLFTVFLHEMSHLLAGLATCARIQSLEVNLDEGGLTTMTGGVAWVTLPAGYTGSAFWGAVMIVFSWSRLLALWGSILLAIIVIITLWWAKRHWVPVVVSLLFLIILFALMGLGFAGVDYHVLGVRLYIGFLGMLSCMYSTLDIWEDTVKERKNASDASQCAKLMNNKINPKIIGAIWLVYSVIVWFIAMIVGLLLNEALDEDSDDNDDDDEDNVDPTPWDDDEEDIPEVFDDMPLDFFIFLIAVPVLAVVCVVAYIVLRIMWNRGMIRNDPLDKRRKAAGQQRA